AQGLLAGLGSKLEPFLKSLAADIHTHGDFAIVAHALKRLHFIERSAGPLGAPATLDLGGAREAADLRLVHLCDELPSTPEEEIGARLVALRLVAELLKDVAPDVLDHTLFDEAIDRVAGARPPAEILGAVLA